MLDLSRLVFFVVAALILLVTPGPAVLYVVARSVDQGRLAGIVSVLGIGVGTLFHVAAAALGLSALLVSSALAFNVVKYVGAAYLIYLGLRRLFDRSELKPVEKAEPKKLSHIFYQGIVVNVLNPKTALFFFAFLPQFINPALGNVAWQTLLLGTLFVVMGIMSDSVWALLAGTAGQWLRGSWHFLWAQRYFAGGAFIFLGMTAALSSKD